MTTGRLRAGLEAAAVALLASVAIGSLLMLCAGASPAPIWGAMVARTFGSSYEIGEWLFRSTSLALAGLSVAFALDAGLFNIGAEGQMTAGLVACAATGVALPGGTPAWLAVPACTLAAVVAGALVGGLVGALRVYRGAHEVITSILLNFIVAGTALWIGNAGMFVDGSPASASVVPGAQLPDLHLGGSAANASVAIAAAAAVGVWWLRARTTWGIAWRATAAAPAAARAAGIDIDRVRLYTMLGSGGLAGLAATNLVLGHEHAYTQGLGQGIGLTGVAVALLGRTHPVGVLAAALMLGLLWTGGLAVGELVPKELTEMLQGVVVLAVACSAAWLRAREGRVAHA